MGRVTSKSEFVITNENDGALASGEAGHAIGNTWNFEAIAHGVAHF